MRFTPYLWAIILKRIVIMETTHTKTMKPIRQSCKEKRLYRYNFFWIYYHMTSNKLRITLSSCDGDVASTYVKIHFNGSFAQFNVLNLRFFYAEFFRQLRRKDEKWGRKMNNEEENWKMI